MQFHHGMCVLAVLAESPTGRSVGELHEAIVKRYFAGNMMACSMTKAQVSTCVRNLKREYYVTSERVAYRKNIDKVIYKISEGAALAFSGIVEHYSSMEKQLFLYNQSNGVGNPIPEITGEN